MNKTGRIVTHRRSGIPTKRRGIPVTVNAKVSSKVAQAPIIHPKTAEATISLRKLTSYFSCEKLTFLSTIKRDKTTHNG